MTTPAVPDAPVDDEATVATQPVLGRYILHRLRATAAACEYAVVSMSDLTPGSQVDLWHQEALRSALWEAENLVALMRLSQQEGMQADRARAASP